MSERVDNGSVKVRLRPHAGEVVMDLSGINVALSSVLEDRYELAREGVTNSLGESMISNIVPGEYYVKCRVMFHRERKAVTVVSGGTTVVDIGFRPRTRISGQVVTGNGSPVAGAEIWVGAIGQANSGMERASICDSRGAFSIITGMDMCIIGARASGYASSCLETLTSNGMQGRVITIELNKPGLDVDGRVINENGHAVPNARIEFGSGNWDRLSCAPGMVVKEYAVRTTTDELGRWRVSAVADGTHRLSVWHRDYGPLSQPVLVDAMHTQVSCILKKGSRVHGRVRDERGAVIPRTRVRFDSSHISPVIECFSDEDGYFSLSGLPRTKVTLVAEEATHGECRKEINLSDVVDVEWSPIISKDDLMRLRVVDASGRPVPSAAWSARSGARNSIEYIERAGLSDGDGMAFVAGFARFAQIDVTVRRRGNRSATLNGVKTGGEVRDVVMVPHQDGAPARIWGSVITSDGQPARGAVIRLQRRTGGANSVFLTDQETGMFEIGQLEAGEY